MQFDHNIIVFISMIISVDDLCGFAPLHRQCIGVHRLYDIRSLAHPSPCEVERPGLGNVYICRTLEETLSGRHVLMSLQDVGMPPRQLPPRPTWRGEEDGGGVGGGGGVDRVFVSV